MKVEGVNKIVTTTGAKNITSMKMSSLAQVVKKADVQGLGILATKTIQTESFMRFEGIDEHMRSEMDDRLSNFLENFLRSEAAQGMDPLALDKMREVMPRVRLLVRDKAAPLSLISVKPIKIEEIKVYMDRGDFGLVDQEDERRLLLPRSSVYAQREIKEIRTIEGEALTVRMMTEEEEEEFEEVREAFLEIYTQVNKTEQKETKEATEKTSTAKETKVAPQKRSVEVDKKIISHRKSKAAAPNESNKVTAKMAAAAEKKREKIRNEAIEKEEFGKELSKKRAKKGLESDLRIAADAQEYSHNLGKSHKFNRIPRAV